VNRSSRHSSFVPSLAGNSRQIDVAWIGKHAAPHRDRRNETKNKKVQKLRSARGLQKDGFRILNAGICGGAIKQVAIEAITANCVIDNKELELLLAASYSCANSVRCLPQLLVNAAADSEWTGIFQLDLRRSFKLVR